MGTSKHVALALLIVLLGAALFPLGASAQDGGQGQPIRQWATSALASSQYSDPDWSAAQATGAPDTVECGDIVTAWASASSSGQEWLLLQYSHSVIPTQVNIYQTNTPGAIVKVSVITVEGEEISLPDSADPPGHTACPGVFTIDIEGQPPAVDAVKIYLDQDITYDWNEIDAVELVGYPSGAAPVATAEATEPVAGSAAGQIAFASDRSGSFQITVMNADGSDPRNLTNNDAENYLPAWSPDGSQIAFRTNRDASKEIAVMNADGSDQHNLTDNDAGDGGPAWSPDGSQIAFYSDRDGNEEIYVMNADGSDPRNLTNNDAGDSDPTWSPDGSQIAFVSDRDGDWEITVMNADGSDPHNLTSNSADDGGPAWSPDGKQIAFMSSRSGNYEIYVMNADGSNPRRLTNNDTNDYEPAWSPDGSQIAFRSDRDGNEEIYVMNADGSDQHNLTNNDAMDMSPAWQPAPAVTVGAGATEEAVTGAAGGKK
jgi:Tol biopolymer transport system component